MSSNDSFRAPMPVTSRNTPIDLLESTKPLRKATNPFRHTPPPLPLATPLSHPQRPTTLDHLSCLKLLGQGAQGAVYRVHDHRTNERLALKIINMPHDMNNLFMVIHERNASVFAMEQQMNGVVKVKEIFQDSGRCFILMRLGRATLSDEIQAYDHRMPLRRIAFIMRDLVVSLSDMHSKGMIHRDIKPDNVLLDSHGRACLADLGLAHFGAGSAAGFCGTCEYMAPEVKYGYYGPQADVWSLGVLFYYLVIKRLPFFHTDRTMIPDVASRTPLPLDPDEVPFCVSNLLHRMLTVDPNQRITMDKIKEHHFFSWIIKMCSAEDLQSAQALPPSLCQPPQEVYADAKPMRHVVEPTKYPGHILPGYDWTSKNWTVDPMDVVPLPMPKTVHKPVNKISATAKPRLPASSPSLPQVPLSSRPPHPCQQSSEVPLIDLTSPRQKPQLLKPAKPDFLIAVPQQLSSSSKSSAPSPYWSYRSRLTGTSSREANGFSSVRRSERPIKSTIKSSLHSPSTPPPLPNYTRHLPSLKPSVISASTTGKSSLENDAQSNTSSTQSKRLNGLKRFIGRVLGRRSRNSRQRSQPQASSN
jgi:serine/threonine protein kinase